MHKLNCDIHSHSGYSGGVGKINLESLFRNLKVKGIDVFGTGDILHKDWLNYIRNNTKEEKPGLFCLKGYEKPYLILQTEIIITTEYKYNSKKRKSVHNIILFPSFDSIERTRELLVKEYDTSLKIGRPFVKTKKPQDVSDFLYKVQSIDKEIVIIPAHVFTPDGVFGGKNPINYLEDFYGDFSKELYVFETGLSADPEMLDMVPQLSGKVFLSNSDAHSDNLNRIGRNFFSINCEEISYLSIIRNIKRNNINFTCDFFPQEGRYYLTGHRVGKHESKKETFFNHDEIPKDFICPECGKKMTPGVQYRVNELNKVQKDLRRKPIKRISHHIIPLIEVIAYSLKVKSVKSKKVVKTYFDIVKNFNSELELWQSSDKEIDKLIKNKDIKRTILKVKREEFSYSPPGFDGNYGVLKI